jgi:hypothetical protein
MHDLETEFGMQVDFCGFMRHVNEPIVGHIELRDVRIRREA